MAGVGPAPKDPSRRARPNKDPNPTTRLDFQRGEPPELPSEIDWHARTRSWWAVWQRSPMAALMTEVDWADMLDTALMHHAMWERGQWTLAAEVRLRTARFGGTPVDRMRLRIVWADADEKDGRIPQTASVPSAGRYGALRAIPTPEQPEEGA